MHAGIATMKFLVLLILSVFLGFGSCFKPVRVGDLLPSVEAGSVSGLVFLLDHTTLYIRDFQFQVLGTDGNFCAGGSTLDTSDAYTIPSGSATPSPFTNGYSSSDIELPLPDGVTVAQLAWFGVCSDSDTTNVLASAIILPELISNVPCNATFIGELPSGSNGIAGRVYLLDRITLAVIGFSYDGEEPDIFFWVGPGSNPSISGFPCTYEDDIITSLPAFSDQDVVVHVPPEAEGTEINHFALYCRSNNIGLVHVPVATGLIPGTPLPITTVEPVFIGSLRTRAHGVRGNVFALDEKTLMLTEFSFDGVAPGAYFYAVRGPSVTSDVFWIVPDETGSTAPLRRAYNDRTIVLTLPDPITIHDIDWFLVWCVPFRQNFGEVQIPDNIELVEQIVEFPTLPPIAECTMLEPEVPVNCQQLTEDITVSWSINSLSNTIIFQLCGCVLPENYIAFGISGSESRVQMVGGDVTWTWLDNDGVHAGDLDLTQYSQCLIRQSGGEITQGGACPDVQDDVSSVSGFREGCTTCIKFARPLVSSDPRDKPFSTDGDQFMIWSMGPVGTLDTPLGDTIPVPFRHYARANPTDDLRVNLSRSPVDECNLACSGCEVVLEPWPQPVLEHTTTIRAQIGQSGSERGYAGITGISGWGISWYLNGLLIPNITVYRGIRYTFVTEGGEDPTNPARYHPFYITDNERGGYLAKSTEDQQEETIYAGFDEDEPLGVGRYCEYKNIDTDRSSEFDTFDAYLPTLVLECDDGDPGAFTWTPDENTSDTVYYQCATHQFLGWKIDVLDISDLPQLTIHFINDSPRISGNTVEVDFILSRPAQKVTCHLISNGRTEQDCSSGRVRFTNVSPGKGRVRVIATNIGVDRVAERRSFEIPSDPSSCTTHLINDGVTVDGSSVSVQFAGTGPYDSFICSLDSEMPIACNSTLQLLGLQDGSHRLRIATKGCAENQRLIVRFTSGTN